MKQIGGFTSHRWGPVIAWRATYGAADGPLAVLLLRANGERLATLSVNMYEPECSRDSRHLPPDCFYVKQWSENESLAAEALASGLFIERPDLPVAHSGHVTAPVWQIKEAKARWSTTKPAAPSRPTSARRACPATAVSPRAIRPRASRVLASAAG